VKIFCDWEGKIDAFLGVIGSPWWLAKTRKGNGNVEILGRSSPSHVWGRSMRIWPPPESLGAKCVKTGRDLCCLSVMAPRGDTPSARRGRGQFWRISWCSGSWWLLVNFQHFGVRKLYWVSCRSLSGGSTSFVRTGCRGDSPEMRFISSFWFDRMVGNMGDCLTLFLCCSLGDVEGFAVFRFVFLLVVVRVPLVICQSNLGSGRDF